MPLNIHFRRSAELIIHLYLLLFSSIFNFFNNLYFISNFQIKILVHNIIEYIHTQSYEALKLEHLIPTVTDWNFFNIWVIHHLSGCGVAW